MSTAIKLGVAVGATILVIGVGLAGGTAVANGDVRSAAPITNPAIATVPGVVTATAPVAPAPTGAPALTDAAAPAAAPAVTLSPTDAAATTVTTGAPVRPTVTRTPTALLPAAAPGDPATFPALGWGDSGTAVETLQKRLTELGFRLGSPAGEFDGGTWSAVLAFQKFEGLDRTGDVTPDVWVRLYEPEGWLPPSQSATTPKIEVDLDRQLLFVLNIERPGQVVIMNTSTGGRYYYTDKDGSTAYAFTPEGDFRVYRRYDGVEIAPLGTLYRPFYFHGGWAVHGSPSVPAYAASHGCVRLSNDDMDWLWDRAPADLAVTVRATMNPDVLREQEQQALMDSFGGVAPVAADVRRRRTSAAQPPS